MKDLINITTQPIVLLLGFASYLRVYALDNILNLRKRQVLFKKPTFRKKSTFSDQETWELSPFLGRFKVQLFYTRNLLIIRYLPFNRVEE